MVEVKSLEKGFGESEKEFRELAADMIPVIKGMMAVLKKHDIESLASVTVGEDGYFRFSYAGTDCEFTRTDKNSNARINFNHTVEMEWGDDVCKC